MPAQEDPAERKLFETITETNELALEPEQHAMLKELRRYLPTIPADERNALIDDIENAISKTQDERDFEL